MVMDSQVESKEQLKKSLEEFLYKEDAKESLVDEEPHETIDLILSME